MAGKSKHKPALRAPTRKETPRALPAGLPGAGNSHERLAWRFTHADNEGPWGFGEVNGAALSGILGHLKSFESMTVNEAFHSRDYPGKDYDVEDIPTAAARTCLENLGLADQTKIWVLRCAGKPRLYGFLTGNVFHVVFWDPEHEIWPSQPRNT